ncbi:MAG: ADP-ribosyltransferase, partial [Candidatus Paceibacterota bacterium]
MDAFFKIPAQIADSKLIQYNQNISKHPENIRLEGMRLIHRTGSNNYQKEAREQIISEITNNTQLGKYLNDKIIAETKAFEENPVRLYRSGKYKNSIIESFTSNPDSAFTTNFDDVPPGNDFHKDYDELKTDGWKVLSGVLQSARYPEEYEVTLINIDELNKYRNKQKQNSAYLEDVTNFMKLNYKCPKGTVDDSNKCNTENESLKNDDITVSNKNPIIIEKLTDEVIAALRYYTDEGYRNINHSLRHDGGESMTPEATEHMEWIDAMFEDKRAILTEGVVYRGYNSFELSQDDVVGSTIKDPAFVSVSNNESNANIFIDTAKFPVMAEIHIPDGSRGLAIPDSIATLPVGESEILLPRDSKFKITKSENKNGIKYITMDLITDRPIKTKQNSAYLDEVAEFIKLNYKCPTGTVDETNACKPTAEQTNELKNLRLDVNPKNKEHKKPRSTTPDRFFETNLSTNINQELSSSITSVIKNAYKNIPELNGVPLKVVNVNEKENRDLENAYAAHDMNKIYLNDKYFSDINEMQEKLTKEVESGFHPKGCNTAESIITHELGHLLFNGMALRGDEKWDNISEVIQEAKDSGELAKVSRYALSEAGNGELSEAASEIFASIFHTKEEDKEPVVKKVRDILFNKFNENSAYLADAFKTIKQNYKCPKGTVDDSNKCNPEQEKSNTSDSKSASETFIGFKADHDFSSKKSEILKTPRAKLVSLIDTELDNKLNNLSKQAKILSKSEKHTLSEYSLNEYININEFLTKKIKKHIPNPEELDILYEDAILEQAKENVEKLDNIFKNVSLPENIVSYRGLRDDILVENRELMEALDTPGSEVSFDCFSSSSVMPFVASNFATGYNGRLIELRLPKGSKALYIAEV